MTEFGKTAGYSRGAQEDKLKTIAKKSPANMPTP
jgi:hypothetical protein